ncbi:MAG: pseudouridine synthase [Rhodothermales bacterium]
MAKRPDPKQSGKQTQSQQRARRQRASRERAALESDAPPASAQAEPASDVRLNKYIAQAGVCSRRKADELIAEGRVKIDGTVVTELGTRVSEGATVEVGGRVISPRSHYYLLLNKPGRTITTTSDEQDRGTVMDLLDGLPNKDDLGLFPVGRLDRDTVGVLLITNDGELANRLMHPRYETEKLYVVKTKEAVKPHEIDQLREGIALEDGLAKADRVTYVAPPNHHEIGLQLHEGRNRQIRRMMEVLGHEVVHLERVRYAGLTTEGLRRGKWRRLTPHEVKALRRRLKLR